MEDQTTRTAAIPPVRTPTWWTDKHTSAWDRVKVAFQRDLEQTVADFSSTGGRDLNQSVGDTVQQALGNAPIPAPGVKTHPTDPMVAVKVADKAHDHLVKAAHKADEESASARGAIAQERAKLSEKVAEIRTDAARDQVKASEKIAEAQKSSAADIQKQNEKVAEAAGKRDEAAAKWRQAEQEARYGYAARTQRPNEEWSSALEGSLRDEWNGLGTGRTWDDSRAGIRRGWDYVGRMS